MSKLRAKAPAAVTPGKIKMLTMGKSGVGKTWLSMDFPAPYYIDCEGGARLGHYQAKLESSGGAYFGIDDGALDFDSVIAQVEALATERHGFKTLAFGSITKLYQHAIAQEQARLGDKDAFGASKKPAVSAMRRLVMWIQRLDMNVLFEAHEGTEWGVNPRTGQREELGVVPDIWDKLVYELDLTLRIEKRGPQRVCTVKKSRLTGFPEGDSFACDYAAFAERYGKDFMEAAPVPVELATNEQVSEINRLLSIIQIDAKEIDAMLHRANAEKLTDLSTEKATAMTAWLLKKVSPT